MADFPTHPDAVTPAWLDQRLHDAGLIPKDARVSGVAWHAIGTGQVGDSVRFTVSYDGDGGGGGGGPATLAGKFPAADPTSRATAAAFGLYAKEVGFYRDLAATVDVRVPGIVAAELADDGVDFLLLLEDLGPARGGNQLDSCSADDAAAAIVQAAALHAPSWGNAAMLATPWLQPRDGLREQIFALYPQAQAIFRERYGDSLEPEFMALCEDYAAAFAAGALPNDPLQCLIHGDFRLDNMLFDIRGGTEPIAVLDWQTLALGKAMTDIGYFLGTGIGDALRRAHEGDLLDLYCAEMAARGVPLTREAVWDDYVIGALHGVSTAVFSAAYVERTERGDANFLSMARGGCALALQHGSLAKLKG